MRAVLVVLTAKCNLACRYCFQNRKQARSMPWPILRASLGLLLRSRRDEVRLTFYGGEPLLELSLIRRAVEYVERRRRASLVVTYELITNGTLLDAAAVRFLEEHDFLVQLSFDGVAAAQRFRGAGTFRILDRLLVRLREANPRFYRKQLKVVITLTPAILDTLPASVGYFLDRGIAEFAVSPCNSSHDGWQPGSIRRLDRVCRDVSDLCLRHWEATGEIPLVLLRRSQPPSAPHSGCEDMCGVGRGESLSVDVDGQVYGCALFAESFQVFTSGFLGERLKTLKLGDVRDPMLSGRLDGYLRAVRGVGFFDGKRDKYSSYGRCSKCRYVADCRICPVSIGQIPGNSDTRRVPDFLCAFNLVWSKYLYRFPAEWGTGALLPGRRRLPPLVREFETWARRRGEIRREGDGSHGTTTPG